MSEQQQLMSISQSGVQSQPTAFTHHIYFDGDIVDVINYREEVSILRDASPLDTVVVHIETDGGSLSTAKHIISNMKQCQAHLVTEVNGICASAGTLIFLAGDEYRLGEDAEFMFHTATYGYGSKANNVAEYVNHMQKTLPKFLHKAYKYFMTSEEIDKLISGTDYWFDTEEVIKRLRIRGEKLFEESGEFEPDPEVMKEWSKGRLLSFMFDEEYDNDYWEGAESPVCLDDEDSTEAVYSLHNKIYNQVVELSEQVVCVEDDHIMFADIHQIWKEGMFMVDGRFGFSVGNKPEQIKYSVKELKVIADNLGIDYKKNASQKVMAKLVLEFVSKVVDILNS